MSNFRFSSKMHLFIIISAIIIAVGVAVGLICQFAADGYFNYGSDWSSYKSVTVTYEYLDFADGDDVEKICDDAFDKAGVNSYVTQSGNWSRGGVIVYKFTLSTSDEKLAAARDIIQTALAENSKLAGDSAYEDILFSDSYVRVGKTLLGGGKTLMMCGIGLASVVAFEFLYFLIRYKVSMALGALLANVHNLALYISLLAITRIPVGTSMFAFAALTVLFTMIGCCFLFGKTRKNIKTEELSKLSAFEIVDLSAGETFKFNLIFTGSLAAVAVLMFVLLSISSLSPLAIISPVLCALVTFVSCAYGTLMFTPSVYSRFRQIGAKFKKNKPKASAKKAEKSK